MDSSISKDISELIFNKIKENQVELKASYEASKSQIGYFYIDDLLPEDLAKQCFDVFPDTSEMRCLKSMREYKYVSAQMNNHHELLEQVLYAFQDSKIVNLIGEICSIDTMLEDYHKWLKIIF